jgi:hypothetical protein
VTVEGGHPVPDGVEHLVARPVAPAQHEQHRRGEVAGGVDVQVELDRQRRRREVAPLDDHHVGACRHHGVCVEDPGEQRPVPAAAVEVVQVLRRQGERLRVRLPQLVPESDQLDVRIRRVGRGDQRPEQGHPPRPPGQDLGQPEHHGRLPRPGLHRGHVHAAGHAPIFAAPGMG